MRGRFAGGPGSGVGVAAAAGAANAVAMPVRSTARPSKACSRIRALYGGSATVRYARRGGEEYLLTRGLFKRRRAEPLEHPPRTPRHRLVRRPTVSGRVETGNGSPTPSAGDDAGSLARNNSSETLRRLLYIPISASVATPNTARKPWR